jgi:hypothetical protein
VYGNSTHHQHQYNNSASISSTSTSNYGQHQWMLDGDPGMQVTSACCVAVVAGCLGGTVKPCQSWIM